MGRPKNSDKVQKDLLAAIPKPPEPEVASTEPPPAPAMVEYQFGGTDWRCGKFHDLAGEFDNNLKPSHLPLFHQVMSSKDRPWQILRRLFGFRLMRPPMDGDPEELTTLSRREVQEKFGISSSQLISELNGMRGAWKMVLRPTQEEEPSQSLALVTGGQSVMSDQELLSQYGFEQYIFESSSETKWFVKRLGTYQKILDEPFASELARSAIMAELGMRRLDNELSNSRVHKPGSSEWKVMQKMRSEMESGYNETMTKIEASCPWISVAGKYDFTHQLSEITRAIQQFTSNGDTRLRDGVFNATGIMIELRRSIQMPEPKYRAGLVAYLNAAREGMWDPNWEPPFRPGLLRKIDGAFKQAFIALDDADGPDKIDLMSLDEKDEYEDLVLPSELNKKEGVVAPVETTTVQTFAPEGTPV